MTTLNPLPTSAASSVAEQLISLGIKAFWNFTHFDLRMEHTDVLVENVHLGDSLTTLSYGLNTRMDTE